MEIILLERVAKLGQMGDTVKVKDGFARNYLLPKGKALRANKANLARFESERVQLETRNLERKGEAEAVSEKLDGNTYVAVRSAGETGQLYGSVAARDISALLDENGFTIARAQVAMNQPIKTIGLHSVIIVLHPEVEAKIVINVARSDDEAERQAAGEDMSRRDVFADEPAEEEAPDLEEVFDNPEDVELEELPVAGDETGTAGPDGEGAEADQDESKEADVAAVSEAEDAVEVGGGDAADSEGGDVADEEKRD